MVRNVKHGVRQLYRLYSSCEAENILLEEPADCTATLADETEAILAKIDARIEGCDSTTGMLTCRLDGEQAPTCVGDAALAAAQALVEAAFGLQP